ncbi:MAG: phosphoribosylformylglycinamidine synthase subunit PurQ [Desulfohalobiaceae bacterium]|nr:phosphoribosylformylglycinamidine synthase subunit PurQ [Desulfohalobiaceae bacterium]
MHPVHTLVLTGYGTNCERETAYACRTAGADSVAIAHFADLIQESVLVSDYNFLVFPGGFLDGDHLGAAQAAAVRYLYSETKSGRNLLKQIKDVHDRGGLIMGICNGFQLLAKLGLLPALHNAYFQRQVSLSYNDSSRFEDRWVNLRCNPGSPCVFTRGTESFFLPVRNGEGKLIAKDEATLGLLEAENLICLQYSHADGRVTQDYPLNPNGSPLGIAGLTDPSGRIFGLMPHPEAFNHFSNHPGWTRGQRKTMGAVMFQNGIEYLKNRNLHP